VWVRQGLGPRPEGLGVGTAVLEHPSAAWPCSGPSLASSVPAATSGFAFSGGICEQRGFGVGGSSSAAAPCWGLSPLPIFGCSQPPPPSWLSPSTPIRRGVPGLLPNRSCSTRGGVSYLLPALLLLGPPALLARLAALGDLVLLAGLAGGQRLVVLPLEMPHVREDQPAGRGAAVRTGAVGRETEARRRRPPASSPTSRSAAGCRWLRWCCRGCPRARRRRSSRAGAPSPAAGGTGQTPGTPGMSSRHP